MDSFLFIKQDCRERELSLIYAYLTTHYSGVFMVVLVGPSFGWLVFGRYYTLNLPHQLG